MVSPKDQFMCQINEGPRRDPTVRRKARIRKKIGRRHKRNSYVNFTQIERACERFWEARGMPVPTASHCGIDDHSPN